MKEILIDGTVWVLDKCSQCPHRIHYPKSKPKSLCNHCKGGSTEPPPEFELKKVPVFDHKKVKQWDGQQKKKGK